jgi:hypothetical protein
MEQKIDPSGGVAAGTNNPSAGGEHRIWVPDRAYNPLNEMISCRQSPRYLSMAAQEPELPHNGR